MKKYPHVWVTVFRIIPEFRILRLESQPQNSELGRLKFLLRFICIYLKTIYHLNLKLLSSLCMLQFLRFEFLKFRIFEILNIHT